MKYTEKEKELMEIDSEYREPRESIECKDGFIMSVQANQHAYCTPRENDCRWYGAVEVGFPSEQEELLMPYIEGGWDEGPINTVYQTVYPYTPAKVVMDVIVKHGGMIGGELPPLKIGFFQALNA